MRYIWTVIISLTLLGLWGCGSDSESAKDGKKSASASADKTVRINLWTEPKSLDPSLIDAVAGNRVLRGLMEGLVSSDKDMNPVPGVAESWEHNDDYTEWTFHLRKNAVWQNGDPVTAKDFKYAAERVCTPETYAPYAQIVYGFLADGEEFYKAGGSTAGRELKSVRAIDEHTVQYEMAFPVPFFLNMAGFATWFPLNQKAVETGGPQWANKPDTFVGNGPFRMSLYASRDRIEMTRSDTYWDKDNIFWDKVVLYMIDDANSEDQAFRTGSLDVTNGVALAHINYWKDRPEFLAPAALATYYIIFNTTRPPFDNADVRRAFSMTIDRDLIVNKVVRGGQIISQGFVPHGMTSAQPGKQYRDVAPDMIPHGTVEEARALIAKAGYNESNPMPPLEYTYSTDDANKLIAEQMQRMWAKAFGVDVRLQNAEFGVVKQDIINGNFQFARASWVADFADPLNFLDFFVTGNTKNGPRLANKKYDDLIFRAQREGDPLKREQIFIEAETLLVHDVCAIAPIYTYAYTHLQKTDLIGMDMNALGNLLYTTARRAEK